MAEVIEWPIGWLPFDAPVTPTARPEGAPPDWEERERALDVRSSWIVEAPAGSGKTGLLIQRYLKLLAEGEVERPEQVLAITFTRAATEEVRERVMAELEGAEAQTEVTNAFARVTRSLAEAVLRRDREAGWELLHLPRRLNVRTIDSVCAEIANALPVTSGGTAGLKPIEDAEALYREAARRTLLQLGGEDRLLDEALRMLLLHRDGSLGDCERLIAEMLETRNQWGELVPLGPEQLTEERLEGEVRAKLNQALERAVCDGLTRFAQTVPEGMIAEMARLAGEFADLPAYKPEVHPFAICRNLRNAPDETIEHLEHWRAMVSLLVKKDGEWRNRFYKNDLGVELGRDQGLAVKELVGEMRGSEQILAAIKEFAKLPPARYPEEQWVVAKALFRVLSHALIELQLVFAERGECDFVEPALLAGTALRPEDGVEDLLSATGMDLRHLLVDEMQDTSTSQYELIELLTRGWGGDGRTVFLVGDPKQSIYLFRQARVERFLSTMRAERLGGFVVGRLRLTANFRSQAGLVQGYNSAFAGIFPFASQQADDVPFVAAEAVRAVGTGGAGDHGLAWHLARVEGTRDDCREGKRRLAQRNAADIRAIVEGWRARPLPPGREEPWRIAVLVRSRGELREIVAAMRADGTRPAVPFRAVKVEPLKERREVLDLVALTRALLHPADRVAWWAVLRAPWCGLTLKDLHVLAGEEDPRFTEESVMDLAAARGELLEPESIARLERVWPVLQAAVSKRSRLRLPELVERTWRSLGGDAALGEAEMANAERFLKLLESIDEENGGVELAELSRRMERLYAAPSAASDAVDLMTIHGAKGLEWDVVLVPEMERRAPPMRNRLLDWEEIAGGEENPASVVLAPIAGRGEDSAALNTWLRGIRSARESAERRRLFYVACTRAREELHLFGAANVLKDGSVRAESGSLLEAAWPAAEPRLRPEIETIRPAQLGFAGLALAAAASEEESEARRPALLERFPLSFDPAAQLREQAVWQQEAPEEVRGSFDRPQGSFAARSFGNAVHASLELAVQHLAAGATPMELAAEARGWKDRVAGMLRADGLPPSTVDGLAARVIAAVANTLQDRVGQWVLGPRVEARSEYEMTVWRDGWIRVRMDRMFRGGAVPTAEGSECLWIVDYKTASHGAEGVEAFLGAEKEKYAAQMEGYARAAGEKDVRVGLWYPMLPRLVWWVV